MKTLRYIGIILLALSGGYFAVFFALGWLAPHNAAINRFYSSTFYSLRCVVESDYLNRLERHVGAWTVSVTGEPAIRTSQHAGIGFEVPEALESTVESIPNGAEVIGYVGKKLDRDSIGVYHNELRKIERKGA